MAAQCITAEEKSQFFDEIDNLVWKHDISYIEAVTHYCELNGLEIETVASLIGPSLKSKIQDEAIQLRYLPKTSHLPI